MNSLSSTQHSYKKMEEPSIDKSQGIDNFTLVTQVQHQKTFGQQTKTRNKDSFLASENFINIDEKTGVKHSIPKKKEVLTSLSKLVKERVLGPSLSKFCSDSFANRNVLPTCSQKSSMASNTDQV